MKLKHLAIIMDGNGRWAESRGRDRTFGHIKGAQTARRIIETSVEIGIPHLTLYAFSSENWARPASEVHFLMRLLARHLNKERKKLVENNVRFTCIGDLSRLPENVQREVEKSIEVTAENTGMVLTVALSYGGRQEIVAAAREAARRIQRGEFQIEELDEALFSRCLQSFPSPDPDLIIRTSGESRLSNFLTWQSAYSEIFVTPVSWPDFNREHLLAALNDFENRERRFGKTGQQMREENETDIETPTARKPLSLSF